MIVQTKPVMNENLWIYGSYGGGGGQKGLRHQCQGSNFLLSVSIIGVYISKILVYS